jgi:hypothetical protein
MLAVGFPDEASAVLVVLAMAGIALALFRHYAQEKEFITTLFLGALVVRLAFGMFVHVFDLVSFFGADALTFHNQGSVIADHWNGLVDARDSYYQWSTTTARPGWGMNYIVGAIYYLTGKNMLAAQSFLCGDRCVYRRRWCISVPRSYSLIIGSPEFPLLR